MAYADDIVIFHNDLETDATEIIKHAKHYGLTINADKCRSTQRDQEVTFLGAPVSRQRLSIATKAIARATEALDLVMKAPITHHAKLTLTRINVIPMASYAPLVEMDSPSDEYESFDRQVGDARLPAPKDKGGLGVHLPGAYQRQQDAAHEEAERKARHRIERVTRSAADRTAPDVGLSLSEGSVQKAWRGHFISREAVARVPVGKK